MDDLSLPVNSFQCHLTSYERENGYHGKVFLNCSLSNQCYEFKKESFSALELVNFPIVNIFKLNINLIWRWKRLCHNIQLEVQRANLTNKDTSTYITQKCYVKNVSLLGWNFYLHGPSTVGSRVLSCIYSENELSDDRQRYLSMMVLLACVSPINSTPRRLSF